MRRVLGFLVLAACGTGNNYHPVHGGTCPTDTGCEAAVEAQPKFIPPNDDQREETVASVLANRPAPSCASIARTLASTELGNYADEERLAAKARPYQTNCEANHVTAAELACADDARDKPGIAWCAPRLLPAFQAPPAVAAADCPLVAANLEKHFRQQLGNQLPERAKKWMSALRTSCEQDRWPVAFSQCAQTNAYIGSVNVPATLPQPLANCSYYAPQPLVKRIDERLAKL